MESPSEIWAWLLGWLPPSLRQPVAVVATVVGAIAVVAATINPILDLWDRFAGGRGKPVTRDEVLRHLMDGKLRRRDAEFILDQIERDNPLTGKQRRGAKDAILDVARNGGAAEREALRLFALSDYEQAIKQLRAAIESAASRSAPALRKLAAAAGIASSRAASGLASFAAQARARAARRSKPGKYEPLRLFLSARSDTTVQMSFDDLEQLLGGALPPSARKHRAWWANEQSGSHVHARSWLEAGFIVSEVDLAGGAVWFSKAAAS